MPKVLYILFGGLFTVFTSYAIGRLLLARLKLDLYRDEERFYSFLSGASLLHLIVFATCVAHIANKGVFLGIGIAAIGAAWMQGVLRPASTKLFDPLPRFWRITFLGIFSVYAFLYLANAMAPEMSPDGSAYHLGLVARYIRERGFPRITTNMYANLTQGIDLLFAFAFAFGRHSAASLVHCLFTLATPWLMITHARRFGYPVAGIGGAILFLCAPVVGMDGTSAYIDIAVACVVFSVFSLLQLWSETRQHNLLILIGLMAGYCFASKYTAAVAIPYALLFVLWKSRRIRPLIPVALCASLMVIPWIAKNWIVVANPLSPFANRLFPNPYVTIAFEQEYIARMRNWGYLKSPSEIPLELTVKGAALGGLYGPVYILLPLGLLALRRREGRQLLLAAAIFSAGYVNNIGTRFLLPAMPFAVLAFSLAIERSRGILPALVLSHALLSWPKILTLYCAEHAWRLERIPVAAALRITNEEKYLTDRFSPYVVARMLEDFVPPGNRVFSFSGTAEAYTSRELLVGYQSGPSGTLGEFIWSALRPNLAPTGRLKFPFKRQPIRRLRLVQTAEGTDQWNIGELRVNNADKELPRQPDWRIRANVNPWEVQYAIDNNPVSRWRTHEAIRNGMWLEVDLGSEHSIDNVLLEIVEDQGQVNLQLMGQRDKGGWFPLNESPEFTKVPPMKGLRRAAMQELRARNIQYVLAFDGDHGADDYKSNSKLWGLHLVAERGGAHLYYIEGGTP